MFSEGGISPRYFEEFSDANAAQPELFFYIAERVIRKSKDMAFLKKCVSLAREKDHKNAMLNYSLAAAASKRMMWLDLYSLGVWRFGYELGRFFRNRLWDYVQRSRADRSLRDDENKRELRKYITGKEFRARKDSSRSFEEIFQ